jgi:hypothetical protein
MQVLLDIPNQSAWNALQPLIQYLHIEILEQKEVKKEFPFMKKRSQEEQVAIENLIAKGANISNIHSFFSDFEENRKDRPLPNRD